MILDAIKATYGISSFATRHNALQAFLAVWQESSETMAAFISRAREALHYLQSTCPSIATLAIPAAGSVGYSLVDSDKELLISVLLHSTKYTALTTSLLAQSELTVQQVEDALKNEEAHRLGVAAAAAAAASAASTVSNSATPASSVCTFCHMNGHTVERCWKFKEYSKKAWEEVKANSNNSNSNLQKRCNRKDNKDNKGKANAAQENQTPTESAAASIRPPTSSSLPNAWNADTGATPHMMLHRAWFKSYAPSCVGIRVANGQVIYAAGVGTVEFAPVKDGRKMCPVLFSNVLHVPALNQNLLSVLTLTSKHSFRVIIDSNTMAFILDRVPHSYAAVVDRVALLSGSTVVQSEAASPAQVSDYKLWHCCFGHISLSRLKSLVEHKMVSDISLPSVPSAGSAPICPACMDGKQTHDSFPQTASRRSVTLQLVHSDLHGPLPPTANGYKYWISFTDDASRFRRCFLLRKSEAFDAFKQYKAWAEKQSGQALKTLRDDKGGEYMSNEWEGFMLEHGIERQHTTRATPQQNGVAEHTNHILDEGVASLLYDCRAYAHVQKDKRSAFQPKSRKCVFLGYPLDYKGWKCWDPVTGDVFISRDVKFVEMEMPGAELDLPGPRYEPLSGSVGDVTGSVPIPSDSPLVPSVDPATSHSDDSDSDSGSEPDLDDSNDPSFVPPPSDSDSDSDSTTVHHPHFAPSPSASPPSTPKPDASASPEPRSTVSPAPLSQTHDSGTRPAASGPYVTRSGRSVCPTGEWWKVSHPYQYAREQHRRSRHSGSDSESAAEAEIASLEDANSVRALSASELIEYTFLTSGLEPRTYKEAMSWDDAGLWHEASQQEYNALLEHGVWELCELPPGRKAVGCRWVYRIKMKSVLKVLLLYRTMSAFPLSCPLYDSLAPNPLWESVAFSCSYDSLLYSLSSLCLLHVYRYP